MKHRQYVTADVIQIAIRAYDEAYETSQRDLRPEEGDDGHVFGVMVWRRAVGRLAYFAERTGVRYSSRNNHIELQLPNGTLRPYPGGRNPIDETARLPFRADSGAKQDLVADNTEQLSLFDDFPRMRLVLLHVGDIQHGFMELWIGAPYLDEAEEIIGWEFLDCVYSKAGDVPIEDAPADAELHRFPAFKDREVPQIEMGPRRRSHEGEDDTKRNRESE